MTLQYCGGFCQTLTWISHGFACVPHPDPPSRLPPHPIPLGLPSAPALSTCLMHPTWAGDLFHPWYYTCFNAVLSDHPTLAFSHRVQKYGTLHECACHPCAEAMQIFSVSFQFWYMCCQSEHRLHKFLLMAGEEKRESLFIFLEDKSIQWPCPGSVLLEAFPPAPRARRRAAHHSPWPGGPCASSDGPEGPSQEARRQPAVSPYMPAAHSSLEPGGLRRRTQGNSGKSEALRTQHTWASALPCHPETCYEGLGTGGASGVSAGLGQVVRSRAGFVASLGFGWSCFKSLCWHSLPGLLE